MSDPSPSPSPTATRTRTRSPSPTPDPETAETELPGWSQTQPSPSPGSNWSRATEEDDGDPAAAGIKAPPRPESIPASSRTEKLGGSLSKMSEKGLEKAAGYAFAGIGDGLNGLAAEERAPHEDPDDIWLATAEEIDGVGQPVGRILARKLPELPDGQADDAADLISAAIPFGIWLVRGLSQQLPRMVADRRRRRELAAAQAPATE